MRTPLRYRGGRRRRQASIPRPRSQQTFLHLHAGHTKARCLKVFRRLSAYLDNELPVNICQEIRKHLEACPKCEVFLDSLRLTVSLCRRYRTRPLPPAARARLKTAILRAAGWR